MSGTLYLLPTPIAEGPPSIVLPAGVIEVAHRVEYFLAEDAKTARAFLRLIAHPRALRELSIVEIGHQPPAAAIDQWLAPLATGADMAIVSEAGCPAIADPGATLVATAHRNGWKVQPLVGLNGQRFRFLGYLPIAHDDREAAVRALERESQIGETQIFIETPYRGAVLLDVLLMICRPTTRLAVAINLTGADESITQRTVAEWRAIPIDARPELSKRPAVFCLLAK
jgi:16S rRNA (cytidine1402-2'-O)-methyltransferase